MKNIITLISIIISIFLLTNKPFNNKSFIKINDNNNNLKEKINYLKETYNKDIIGIINNKIITVQTIDNNYYLTHDLNNNYSKYGTVFMDYRNKITDDILIFYGHNSKLIDTDFHFLENYLNKDYFTNNKYITLQTESFFRKYQIFSVILTTNNTHTKLGFTNSNNYLNHLNELKKNSIYSISSNLEVNSKIIILQTCNMQKKGEYIIVAAYQNE